MARIVSASKPQASFRDRRDGRGSRGYSVAVPARRSQFHGSDDGQTPIVPAIGRVGAFPSTGLGMAHGLDGGRRAADSVRGAAHLRDRAAAGPWGHVSRDRVTLPRCERGSDTRFCPCRSGALWAAAGKTPAAALAANEATVRSAEYRARLNRRPPQMHPPPQQSEQRR
jgi:hypothetical protein